MTFKEILAEVIAWLKQDQRISYRALKRQFDLDDEYLEDLKIELIEVRECAIDRDNKILIWTGDSVTYQSDGQDGVDTESRFRALLPAVICLLQTQRRVTYRTLKYVFGIDDAVLADIRKELAFRLLAMDEGSEGLVWIGEAPSAVQPGNTVPIQQNTATVAAISTALSDPQPPVTVTDSHTDKRPTSLEDTPTDISIDEPRTASEPIRSVPEAERRQLTVMFCDLVGSTDLSGKLDPEDLREVVRAYQETAAEVIERYDGHIAQYLGDGLLVYFGWPRAHENDAERAVYTGVEIPVAIARLNTRLETDYGVQLAVRIGIHTGPVVVGEMGSGDRLESLATGETVNIAARLEGLAQANTAIISPATAQLVQRSFILKELGLHELKGVAEPMTLYGVVSSREAEHDEHEGMLSGGFDALVGRDEEIGLLLRRWEQSKEGSGQVVLISGEAGLGKSSLVEGLRFHVRQEGYTRITFRCSPYTANSAMHPVIEHVQRVLGWQREDSTETKLDKLEQALQPTSLPMEETVPLLAALLSLSLPEDRYPALTLSPQRQRQLTQDALVAWMLEEAERQPVLAVWEDIHWGDPSTVELLGLFIEQSPTVRMLNVLAYRPEFVPPWPMQSHMTPITLNRLERIHTEALVRRLAGGKMLPQEVVAHVVTKTDGVPLYVEELTKMLLESDLLEEDAEEYVLTGSLSSTAIPATLQDSLMARLDSLPTVKEVAQLGSVLGREFDYEMIQALNAMDESILQAGLSQLVSNELLYQRGRIPRAKFIFRHALIRDAAYQSLLRRTRQHYHEQVAQLLEAQFSDVVERQPELVAHHYMEAGCSGQAISYWQRAGDRASERSAHQEAMSHLTTGLTLLQTLPETLERHEQELPLQTALGAASLMVKGHAAPEVEAAYTRAHVLCQQLGDTQDVFPVLHGLWRLHVSRPNYLLARQLGEELLSLAEQRKETPLYVMAHSALGATCLYLGEVRLARRHLEAAIVRYTPDLFGSGYDPGVHCCVSAALTLWLLGYPDQSLMHAHNGIALAIELKHSFNYAYALVFASSVRLFRREAQEVYNHTENAIILSTEQGFTQWLANSLILQGWALTSRGQQEAGLTQMRQGFTDFRATGADLAAPYFLSLLAEGYGNLKQVEAGLDALKEGLEVIERTGERWWEAELHCLKGQLLLQQSSTNQSEAESCFLQALDIARHQEAKSLELRAATSLARLWQSQGKRDEARQLLEPVYSWFREGFDTADLIDAKVLLDELAEGLS